MTAAAIPLIGLVLVILFSSPKSPTSNIPDAKWEEVKEWQGIEVEFPTLDEEKDYQSIHTFITKNYKTIPTEDAKNISTYLVKYGKEHHVDPKFTAALMSRESGFNRKAVSASGAKGLGQIKDFNYQSLNIKDPYDIQENASGTTVYIKDMLTRWKNKATKTGLALASYFKGFGAVKKSNGNLDNETKHYVQDILNTYQTLCAASQNDPPK